MELDGRLIVESADIMRILEEAFPDNSPLLPPKGTDDRRRADVLMRLERRLFSDWLTWLTSPWWVWSVWPVLLCDKFLMFVRNVGIAVG
jgi:glutathione S-transferase